MKHTFVICAYQESPFLEDCMQSCLEQNSVDAGDSTVILYTSTENDFIKKLCQKYAIPMFTKKGGGIGIDWNNALSFVSTKYATIAHQDDLYLPNYGEKVLAAFEKQADSNIVFTDYAENDAKGQIRERNLNLKIKTIGLKMIRAVRLPAIQRFIYGFGNFISCPAVSYNLERLSDFRFNEELKMTLDWDAWERIMRRQGSIVYISDCEMIHRIHNESETTANTRDKTREKEEFLMYKRYWGTTIAKLLMKVYVYNQKTNEVTRK